MGELVAETCGVANRYSGRSALPAVDELSAGENQGRSSQHDRHQKASNGEGKRDSGPETEGCRAGVFMVGNGNREFGGLVARPDFPGHQVCSL